MQGKSVTLSYRRLLESYGVLSYLLRQSLPSVAAYWLRRNVESIIKIGRAHV